MITVQVANRKYRCTREQADALIAKAGAAVKQGIYAMEHTATGYIELGNWPLSKTQIKKARRDYKKKGIKVHANL